MDEAAKSALLLSQLIIMLHTVGLQQLGRGPQPAPDSSMKDLAAASSTIDLLDMIRIKTRGNLTAQEDLLLDHVIAELRAAYQVEAAP